jgi:hypothetical protein
MEASIPDNLYVFIGFLVVTNIGALITAIGLIVRVSLWIGEFKQRMLEVEKDTNVAHEKIRGLEKGG